MAGKVGGGGGKGMQPNSEPNVIPFIDIMLVLLIIFMVAAPLPTVDVKVDLPPPGNPIYIEPKDKPTTVTLVDAGGTRALYIEAQYVTEQQFADTL
jgi:biopolymer transport protein ExbD